MNFNSPMCRWGTGAAAVALCASVLGGCPGPAAPPPKKIDKKPATPNQIDPDSKKAQSGRRALGLHTSTTQLEFRARPLPIKVGEDSFWNVKVIDLKTITDNQSTTKGIDEFDLVHGKLMHVIVVAKDLSWFYDLSPQYNDYGSFATDITMQRAGDFKIYVDYQPRGGIEQAAQKQFSVLSVDDAAVATPTAELTADKTSGGWASVAATGTDGEAPITSARPNPGAAQYHMLLATRPDDGSGRGSAPLRAGEPALLQVRLTDAAGKVVTNLQSYWGAPGQAVIISADSEIFLYCDAERELATNATGAAGTGDVLFRTVFPSSGLFKVWIRVQHNGLVVAAPFVLSVAAAAPATANAAHLPNGAQGRR